MWPMVLAAVLVAGPAEPIEVTLLKVPTAASTSGSQLMLNAARDKYPDFSQLEFEPPQAVVLANEEIMYGVFTLPISGAAQAIDRVLSGNAGKPPRGVPICMIAYLNLLPEEISDQAVCYHFPWKNDTVRKLAAALVTVQRGGPGELRVQFWGPGEQPLFETLAPAAPRAGDQFLEFDYAKNDLQLELFGTYVISQRLRACLFNY